MKFNLPLYELANLAVGYNNWNIVRIDWGIGNQKYNNCKNNLRIFYPKGSYNPSSGFIGGVGFYASPKVLSNSTEAVLSYQVKFHPSFDPVSGGKLPGLYVSNGYNINGAAGGKHTDDSGCRIMWRKDFDVEAYVYLPYNIQQDASFYNIPRLVRNDIKGDSLWRGLFKFNKNEWNTVVIKIRLNNLNKSDGGLEVTINNVTKTFDKLIWRKSLDYKINFIQFQTFFGGDSKKWATPNDTWTYFKDIQIQSNNHNH